MNAFKSENPAYIIAEIGGNHEGDFSYANDLLDLAIEDLIGIAGQYDIKIVASEFI